MNTSSSVAILIGTFLCALITKDFGQYFQRFSVCFSDICGKRGADSEVSL